MWRRAFRDTLPELGGNWARIVRNLIFMGVALIIVRFLGGWQQMSEELRWLVSSGIALGAVVLGRFFFNLIRAPVFLKFEKEKEPCLIIDGVTTEFSNKISGGCWVLLIRNQGTDQAEDCRGRLVDIEFAQPQKNQSLFRWYKNHSLEWTEGFRDSISIPGRQSGTLRLATWDSSQGFPNNQLRVAYANNPTTIFLPTDREIIFVVSVASKDTLPQYVVCLLDMINAPFIKSLRVWKVFGEQPTLDDCRQLILGKEDFQIE